MDGLDLSGGMLAVAAAERICRSPVQTDVAQVLPLERVYSGVTSPGSFTSGHGGPVAFGPMLAVALPGALFALSVNQHFWRAAGFDGALTRLEAAGRIGALQLIEVAVYGAAARAVDPDHADDTAWIALFRAV